MPRKKKDMFDVTKAVKERARLTVGQVKPTREIPDAKTRERQKATKHKPTLGEILGDE